MLQGVDDGKDSWAAARQLHQMMQIWTVLDDRNALRHHFPSRRRKNVFGNLRPGVRHLLVNGLVNKMVEVKLGDDGYVQYDVFIVR